MVNSKAPTMTLEKAKEIMLEINSLFGIFIDEYTRTGNLHISTMGYLKDLLNSLLTDDEIVCDDCIITDARDKIFFGVYVQPLINPCDVSTIICGCEVSNRITNFRLELDNRLFNGDYTSAEVLALLLFEICCTTSIDAVQRVRAAIDAVLTNTYRLASGYVLSYSKVEDASYIFHYAIIKFLSSCNRPVMVPDCWYFKLLDLDKVLLSINNGATTYIGDEECNSKLSIFNWAIEVAEDLSAHTADVINTLDDVVRITGSSLEKKMCMHLIESLKRSTDTDVKTKSLKESMTLLEGFSLVKGIKANGLRSIEDDLFEYKIRIKNCEDEEDAIFILRQINTRLTILDDYLENTDNISESERRRWESCMNSYRILRAEIGQKKIGNKKQYGIFIDYDKLDQL